MFEFKNENCELERSKLFKFSVFILFTTLLYVSIYLIIQNILTITFVKEIITCTIIAFSVLFSVVFTFLYERKNSCKDPLTGAYNRKKMYIDMSKLIKGKIEFELVFIDMDDFKKINDSRGHEAGDKVLVDFSKKASELSDEINCYRIGGDEFILISIKNKEATMNFDELNILNEFNFSHGVSKFPEDVKNVDNTNDIIDKLLSVADNKMYLNKKGKKKMNKK